MAAVGVESSQGAVLALVEGVSPNLRASQSAAMAMAQFPAESVEASEAAALALVKEETEVESSQLSTLVLAKGRVFDPSVRAWTFTLDGHDMYVIRLGNEETLVYDVASQTWYKWASDDGDLWSVFNGANWTSGGRVSQKYGSNVLVGSDSNGALYFLDPEKAVDDSAVEGRDPRPFTRQVTGQLAYRGYDQVRVYHTHLIGSVGELLDSSLNTVTLSYSDNRGDSYTSAGTITTTDGDYDVRATWRSLGSFSNPGRLFRLEDNGAIQRVDSLTVSTNMGE